MTGHLSEKYRTVFLIAAAVFVILGTFVFRAKREPL